MISIIIPFYNTEKYLEECLSSVKSQTFSDYECLMIDDGSTDSSREIAEKFLDDSRFKLLNKEHVGFPQAKNIGLDNAKGDYICFVDSDDYILPTYLEELYKGITTTNSDVCKCSFIRFRDKPKLIDRNFKITIVEGDNIIRTMFLSTFMWDKIYKKELFDGLRFKDMIALSDTELCPKLFTKVKRYSIINQSLICHRDHNENMTYHVRHFEPTYWEHRLNIYIDMCNYLLEYFPNVLNEIKMEFKGQLNFIKNYIDKEVLNKYLQTEKVKQLLN